MKQSNKKIIGIILTCFQAIVVILWILSNINSNGFNAMIINIIPIPNIGDILSFGIAALLIISLQRIKAKLGVAENFR